MKNALRIPLRLKILISVLLVVTAVVSVITFTMANMFHEDKRTYINDLASIVAVTTAEECRAILARYIEQLHIYARVIHDHEMLQDRKSQLLQGLFEDSPDLISLTLYRGDQPIAAAHDSSALAGAGLTKEQLDEYRQNHPLPPV